MEVRISSRETNQSSYIGISASIDKRLSRIKEVSKLIAVMNSSKTSNITDFELCLRMVDLLIDFSDSNCSVVDRVCGKGNFLLAVIYRFLENGHDLNHVVNNIIYGYDISESQVDHCRRYITLATGIEPSNISVTDSLRMNDKKFTYEVGNYPFNDSSDDAERDTNKLKENTGDLDYKFYLSPQIADNRAVIIRAACLSKNTNVRKEIFSNPSTHTIMNTSGFFNIAQDTMAVISHKNTSINKKTFIDINNNKWTLETDQNTKLSIKITAETIDKVKILWDYAKVDNFQNHWMRSSIARSDSDINDHGIGTPFVSITGSEHDDLGIRYYSGSKVYDNLQTWKVAMNVNGNDYKSSVMKIVPPGVMTSNSMIYFCFDTEKQAQDCINFLTSPELEYLVPFIKASNGNSSEYFANIPWFDFSDLSMKEEILSCLR